MLFGVVSNTQSDQSSFWKETELTGLLEELAEKVEHRYLGHKCWEDALLGSQYDDNNNSWQWDDDDI